MRSYRVKEIWKTLQGEGFFAGRPAVFVRFVGCNLWSGYEQDRERDARRTGADCPRWCDTDFRKEGSRAYTADELVAAMQEVGGPIRFCVLTGGEPLLQLDAALMRALKATGYFVAIETNGTISLRQACTDPKSDQVVPPDWIVCSPKLPEDRLALEYFDELKLVVPDYQPEQYARFARRARPHRVGGHRIPLLWLQPEDGPRLAEARRCAVELALAHPDWRVSVQTHKILGVP
ncbi:7-carboxy-7-deazaguanine synthase [bacterium HR18]|nr:7-carboxy-7-deazaguanine synthase [bacterium HR18]